MADNFLAGKSASVTVGAKSFSFDKFRLSIKCGLVEVTSFTSGGYQVMIPGILSATLTVSGPYNQGNMTFTAGVSYSWNLTFTTNITLIVVALIESLEPDVDVKGRQSVSITAQSSGSFTAAIS